MDPSSPVLPANILEQTALQLGCSPTDKKLAFHLDEKDELKHLRECFCIPKVKDLPTSESYNCCEGEGGERAELHIFCMCLSQVFGNHRHLWDNWAIVVSEHRMSPPLLNQSISLSQHQKLHVLVAILNQMWGCSAYVVLMLSVSSSEQCSDWLKIIGRSFSV